MKAKSPRVSVIIPCYNSEKFLSAAIDSVLVQTFTEFEIVIVDDGSTDNTSSVAAKYTGDRRIRCLRQENLGLSAARNAGINAADGEFIALLDSDDVWAPDKLEWQIPCFADPTVGMVFTDFSTFDADGVIASTTLPGIDMAGPVSLNTLYCRHNFIYPSTVVIRASALAACGGFDPSLRSIEDYDMWLRIAQRYLIAGINAPLVRIRQHDSNMSGNVPRMLESELKVLEKNRTGLPQRVVRRRRAKAYFLNADRYVHLGKRKEALLLLAKGLITYPFLFVDITVVLVKLLLGGETVNRLRRKINGNESLMARLYWSIYNRY